MFRYHFHVVQGVTSYENGIDFAHVTGAQAYARRLRTVLKRDVLVTDDQGRFIIELRFPFV